VSIIVATVIVVILIAMWFSIGFTAGSCIVDLPPSLLSISFKFHTGWEATCYCKQHLTPDNPCRRTRKFGKKGTEEIILRRLKTWCVAAFDKHVNSRQCHVYEVEDPPDSKLASMVELDELPISISSDGRRLDRRPK